MQRGMVRLIVALIIVVTLASFGIPVASLVLAAAPSVLQDACPEPADASSDACAVPSPEIVAPTAPGTVLLRESFDDASRPLYGAASRVPGQFDFAYVDGYLRARRLAESGTAIVLLPYTVDLDHATIAVNARLVGEVEGRYLLLGCRRQDVPTPTGYRFAVAPVSGRFTLVRWEAAGEISLAAWQESPSIRRDSEWNRLEMTCAGSTVDAIVNGQVVASVQDEMYPRGQGVLGVGVFAGQGASAEAHFDDLEVTRR